MPTQTQVEIQAADQSRAYRDRCTFQRKGKTIFRRTSDGWVKHATYPSINAAKRDSRTDPDFRGNLFVA